MRKTKRLKIIFLTICAVFCSFVGANIALAEDSINWTERRPGGIINGSWYAVASDSDGSNLISGGGGSGRIFISSDYGVTWTERYPGGENAVGEVSWCSAASDSDGSHLIVSGCGDSIYDSMYTSSDYGATWTERFYGPMHFISVASDNDGSNLIATTQGGYPGHVFKSSDYGATWTECMIYKPLEEGFSSVSSDDDGSNLAATVNYGFIYTSSDYGATWTERRLGAGSGEASWKIAVLDSDGSNIIAAAAFGRLYTSSDYGATWTEHRPQGDADVMWYGIDIDSDGSNLIVSYREWPFSSNSYIYTSSDYGATWTERQPAGNIHNKTWLSCVSDSDGSNLIVGQFVGRLYTGTLSLNPPQAAISCTPASCSVFANDPLVLNNDSTDPDGMADIVNQIWYMKRPSDIDWVEKAYCSGACSSGTHGPNNYCAPCTPQSDITSGPWEAKVEVRDSANNTDTSDPLEFTIKTDITADFVCANYVPPNPPAWAACDEDFLASEGDMVMLSDTSTPSDGGGILSRVWEKQGVQFGEGVPMPAFKVEKNDIADNSISLHMSITDTNGRTGSITKIISAIPIPTYIPRWIEISPF